jgi:hypothetical protein
MSDKARMGLIVLVFVLAGALLLYMQGEPDEVAVPDESLERGTEAVAERLPEPPTKSQTRKPEPAPSSEAQNAQVPVADGIRIAGHVVNQDTGEPVPKFELIARVGKNNLETTTTEKGEFELAGLSASYLSFQTNHPKLVVTPNSLGLQLTENRTVENLTIYVRPGAVVSGRIYDADTDEGIAGITVKATRSTDQRRLLREGESLTDQEGRYRFDLLQEGPYQINPVLIDGYPATQYAMYELNVVETSLDAPVEKDFALNKGLAISGTVVDEQGKLLPKAYVTGSSGGNLIDASTADAEGRFRMAGFKPGTNVQLKIAYERSVTPGHAVQLQESPIADLLLVFVPISRVSGRLIDSNGKAIPYRYVSFLGEVGGRNRSELHFRTQNDGTFRFDQIGSGTYTVRLMMGRESNPETDPLLDTITLAKGKVLENLTLIVEESLLPHMTISGRVTNDVGAPVANARVQASAGGPRPSADTDEDGFYTIERLEERPYRISASERFHTHFNQQNVQAGTADLNIVLQRTGTVEGMFVDAGTREPITDYAVVVRNSASQEPPRKSEFVRYHDDDGKFVVPRIHPNRTSYIWAKAEGYAITPFPVNGLRSGETRTGTVIPLELETLIQGRVIDDVGEPIAGVQIFRDRVPRNESGKRAQRLALTDANGRFELEGYGRGRHKLTAHRPGQFSVTEWFDVQSNPSEVTIVMGVGATLEVLVTMDGRPLPGARVRLDDFIQDSGQVTDTGFSKDTDADGRVVLRGLPSGMAPLQVDANGREMMRMMRFEADTVAEAVFDVSSTTSSLEGYVMISETESAEARVQLMMDVGGAMETQNATTDKNGFYRFQNLPAGTVNLRVSFSQSQERTAVSTELGSNENKRFDIKMYGGGALHFQLTDIPLESDTTLFLFSEDIELWNDMTLPEIMDIYPSAKGESNLRQGLGTVKNVSAGSYKVLVIAIQEGAEQTMAIAGQIIAPITVKDGEEQTIELSF